MHYTTKNDGICKSKTLLEVQVIIVTGEWFILVNGLLAHGQLV